MRILILSANTGGGHNAAAYALQEELNTYGIPSDVEDCLRFISQKTSDFISWGHSYVYKHLPGVFGRVYRLEEQHPSAFIADGIALGASKYHAFLAERDYTAVVCVHVFASALVAEEQRKFGKSLPHYFVATDYTCSPGGGDAQADVWYIPDESLRDEFVRCGVPRERIVATGIPIRRDFHEPMEQDEMRRALGLPQDGRIVLLCCGSIGCGRLHRTVPEFERRLPADVTTVILCGNNKRLYGQLTENQPQHRVVVEYTDKVAQYMAAADLCISKPGGLSTTELLTVGVPSVMVLVVPGCESRNLEFVTHMGLSQGVTKWEEAFDRTLSLLEHPDELAIMRQTISDYSAGQGAKLIITHLLDHLKNEYA